MRFSIHIFVLSVSILLFCASVVSFLFAFSNSLELPLVIIGIVNLCAILGLIFFLTRGIMKPLDQIGKAITNLGQGDFSVRLTTKFVKELQALIDVFNNAAERLQQERRSIENDKANLEEKVRERTQEIKNFADELKMKIKERTGELEKKVSDLERFQNLAIGRELKMVELKKKIEEMGKAKVEDNK